MTLAALRTRSLALGFALGGLVTFALGFSAPRAAAPADWDYQVEVDVDAKNIKELTKDGWEFVGYLGTSVRGANADETLWRRERK